MVVEAFAPLLNQSMETGIKEIKVQIAEPLNDRFLNFGNGSEKATCQVLLQLSEEMKITRCKIRPLGGVFQCLCGGRARQFCTPVSMKEHNVFTPVFMTLRLLPKLQLVGDEIQLGMFLLSAKPYYTSHFNRRPLSREATLSSFPKLLECFRNASFIC
ncbi:hypothetical protein AVEN_189329-1 [Araneus ventricosus]|uniref:Uncharacterized protein n=1 Tax=Araneus ventricosus TaxID=182803 RepID=A0A4Y2GFH1_ARAVE|nr:hypothetical protein AVEN_189329-1 [Araneus ventricosus]